MFGWSFDSMVEDNPVCEAGTSVFTVGEGVLSGGDTDVCWMHPQVVMLIIMISTRRRKVFIRYCYRVFYLYQYVGQGVYVMDLTYNPRHPNGSVCLLILQGKNQGITPFLLIRTLGVHIPYRTPQALRIQRSISVKSPTKLFIKQVRSA
jgi:hypothetical protein